MCRCTQAVNETVDVKEDEECKIMDAVPLFLSVVAYGMVWYGMVSYLR